MSDSGDEDTRTAVVYWVEDRKVGRIPVTYLSVRERYKGAVAKIKLPGSRKEYVAKVELISADEDALERAEDDVSARIDREALVISNEKRKSKRPNKFGQEASQQSVDLATGKRKSVPPQLKPVKKAAAVARNLAAANKKAAQQHLDQSILSSAKSCVPAVHNKPSSASKIVSVDEGEEFNEDDEASETDKSCADEDQQAHSSPPSPPQSRASSNVKVPDKSTSLTQYPSLHQVVQVEPSHSKQDLKSKESTQKVSEVLNPNNDRENLLQEDEAIDNDISNFKEKRFYNNCLALKRKYSSTVQEFFTDLMLCFDPDSDVEEVDDVEYMEVNQPKSDEKKCEVMKGSGVYISAGVKNIILLAGTKYGPKRMLSKLVTELFGKRIKDLHGTSKIRPIVLRSIFSFMTRNTQSDQALSVSEMKGVINNMACEARRVHNKNKSPSEGRSRIKKFKCIPTPEKTLKDVPLVASPKKTSWTISPSKRHISSTVSLPAASSPHRGQAHHQPSSSLVGPSNLPPGPPPPAAQPAPQVCPPSSSGPPQPYFGARPWSHYPPALQHQPRYYGQGQHQYPYCASPSSVHSSAPSTISGVPGDTSSFPPPWHGYDSENDGSSAEPTFCKNLLTAL